ncbi:MAG: branched-chain amino acid transport system II carrier protein [Parachlamydiaceae bacterium]|nr:branched-chain amino acid transport system II carrier protein [Parachlamydiaceae bacterium]
MSQNRQLSFFVIGLALFSMFFGSGNLIFPLFLGQIAGGEWVYASLGFFLTAVLLPLTGIVAMLVYKGDYCAFFGSLGKTGGLLAILALLTVWIPLGSGPRCVALAYASMLPYLDSPPSLWLISALYCLTVFIVVYKKSRILDVLGYVLTPLLLLCLALIIGKGIDFQTLAIAPITGNSFSLFFRGLTEGYNTMDLIASFFFSASVIEILRNSSHDEAGSLSKTFKASIVGASLLAIVYVGLICLATSHEGQLHDIPKEQLLVHIAKDLLGTQIGLIASGAVFLACFTTSVALATVFANFLAEKLMGSSKYYPLALAVTQLATFGMSIIGLKGITAITEPVLQIFYPTLMILIVINVGRKWLPQPEVSPQEPSFD